MESLTTKANFSDTFRNNLFSLLAQYFNFDEGFNIFNLLSRQYHGYLTNNQEYLWKIWFQIEFLRLEYEDHKKLKDESYLEYFKRSFTIYKRIRAALRGIVTKTAEYTGDQQKLEYLQGFKKRAVHNIIKEQDKVVFHQECFYKNWKDIAEVNDISQAFLSGNIYEYLKNFTVYTTKFYEHNQELLLLSPASMCILQTLVQQRSNVKIYPFMHTAKYRHGIHIDQDDLYGHGAGALISMGGQDKSKMHLIAPNILTFLEQHNQRLQDHYFYTRDCIIESYPHNPEQAFGSVTITNGIRIEAVAKYIHFFSLFDRDYYSDDVGYFFSYQIRIRVEVGENEEFDKCQLTRRYWKIQKGDKVEEVKGEGVIGYYPECYKGMEPFIYESCCPTDYLGTEMSGWFEFEYTEGEKKGQLFQALINPFTLQIEEGTELIDNPMFEPGQHD